MKKLLESFLNAPKSTILALSLLLGFTICKSQNIIEAETYATLSAIVIPLAFTDLFKEKKTEA